jgi:hypothetical protein
LLLSVVIEKPTWGVTTPSKLWCDAVDIVRPDSNTRRFRASI